MGFNSTVIVMNDALHEIESDPEFGKNLANAIMMHSGGPGQRLDVNAGGHVNAASVVDCQHADVISIVAMGGNHGTVLLRTHNGGRHHAESEQIELIKALADKYGFRLVKKSTT
jgi:hypothetical protein